MEEARNITVRSCEVFNDHDERPPNVAEFTFEAPGGVRLEGREPAASYDKARLKGFPNARRTVQNEVVSGPWVVQECTQILLMGRPGSSLPPAGKWSSSASTSAGMRTASRLTSSSTTTRLIYSPSSG